MIRDEKIARQVMDKIATRSKDQLQHPRAPTELRGYVAALMDVFGSKGTYSIEVV